MHIDAKGCAILLALAFLPFALIALALKAFDVVTWAQAGWVMVVPVGLLALCLAGVLISAAWSRRS